MGNLKSLSEMFGGGPVAVIAAALMLAVISLFLLLGKAKDAAIKRESDRADAAEKQIDELQVAHAVALAELNKQLIAVTRELVPLAQGVVRLNDDLAIQLRRARERVKAKTEDIG